MLSKALGCPMSNRGLLETCLQQADAKKITAKQYDIITKPPLLNFPFGPTVDGVFLTAEVKVCLEIVFLKVFLQVNGSFHIYTFRYTFPLVIIYLSVLLSLIY